MIRPGDHVIAGVSGGADSLCLLYVLKEYQKAEDCTVTVVHVEHGIRGKESMEDASFVQEICAREGIPCVMEHVDVPGMAEAQKRTLEEAARMARYEIFMRLCDELRADRIAVAHNSDDQAETVLMNLARGSGIRGLGGMLPVRDRIIRPLLFCSRRSIEAWNLSRGITWRTDRTNLEENYTRNRVRRKILPLLGEVNSAAVSHICRTALLLQRTEEFLRRQSDAYIREHVRADGAEVFTEAGILRNQEELLQEYVLRSMLEISGKGDALKDVGQVHVEKMKDLLAGRDGRRLDLPGGICALVSGGIFRLSVKDKKLSGVGSARHTQEKALRMNVLPCWELPVRMEDLPPSDTQAEGVLFPARARDTDSGAGQERKLSVPGLDLYMKQLISPAENGGWPEKRYTKWLACDTIEHKLLLRTRRSGDYLMINQEGNRKKLKDYLIDCKVPREVRDRILLVADGPRILWVIGLRISADARITQNTRRILQIRVVPADSPDEDDNRLLCLQEEAARE